ncbi:uncharacterized protein LOC135707283 [Ochlerotatus camptorhynchus]|uniref:uncharacterized protein LOC135707283 n=1 Tax=Ochlerotatus camptorhynchus TaxID=644619 RepID=UPI0031E3C0CE
MNNDLQEAQYNILSSDTPTQLIRSEIYATIDIFISNMGNNIAQPITYQDSARTTIRWWPKYATLPTDVGNALPAEVKRTKKRKKNQGQSDGASGRDTMTNVSDIGEFGGTVEHENSAVPSTAKVKLPPLVVMKVPLNTLISELTSLGVAAEFKLSRIGTKVMLRTKAEYEATVKYLKDSRAEYFTHDIPGEKPFKVVIRGLPNFNPKSIEEELKDRYKLAPIAVFRMTRRDENVKTYPDCLFLVHFQKGTVTPNALKAIRSINFIIVQWEPYRGGRHDVTQSSS